MGKDDSCDGIWVNLMGKDDSCKGILVYLMGKDSMTGTG